MAKKLLFNFFNYSLILNLKRVMKDKKLPKLKSQRIKYTPYTRPWIYLFFFFRKPSHSYAKCNSNLRISKSLQSSGQKTEPRPLLNCWDCNLRAFPLSSSLFAIQLLEAKIRGEPRYSCLVHRSRCFFTLITNRLSRFDGEISGKQNPRNETFTSG